MYWDAYHLHRRMEIRPCSKTNKRIPNHFHKDALVTRYA